MILPSAPQKIRFFSWLGWFVLSMGLLFSADSVRAEEGRLTGFHQKSFVIENATVIVRPGERLEGASVVIRDGVIEAVGKVVQIPPDAKIVSGKGLFVYAAFVDAAGNQLLDTEKEPQPAPGRKWDATRYVLAATRADNRKGLTPAYQTAENLKLDSGKLEELRKAGFAAVHVLPDHGIASGQGSLVSTAGQTPRDSVIAASTFDSFSLQRLGGSTYPATLMGATAHLRQAFLDAGHYAAHWKLFHESKAGIARPPADPALEILHQVLKGRRRPVFQADSRDDIHRALDFCAEQDIKPILWGGNDAFRCLDRLAEGKTDLILQLDFGEMPKIEKPSDSKKLTADVKDPVRVQKDRQAQWLLRVRGYAEIHKRGLRFGVSSRELKNQTGILAALRTLIEHGLPREAALAALTTHPAAILGVEDRLGTLEAGKLASVVVLTRPFDDEKAKVRHLFADGRSFEYNEKEKPAGEKSQAKESAEDDPLLGTWKLTLQTPNKPASATLKLTRKDKKLAGTFRSPQGNGKVAAGKIQDDKLEFTVRFGESKDDALLFQFTGQQEQGRLAGEMKSPFGGTAKWTAVRENSETDKTPEKPALAERPPENELPTELDRDRLSRPFQTGGNVFIQNATIITGTGEILEAASLLVRNGKIAALGENLKPDAGMRVIDAAGRFVMPGIIDTHSHIMITEGINESTQSIVPEVRIKDVIDTDSVAEYRALAGGVTAARLFHGSANVIGGQDAVVKLKHGKTAREHILHDAPQGVKFALGENVKARTTRFPNTRLGVEATLNRAFMEALDYRRQWTEYERNQSSDPALLPPRRDLRLEALADIVNHKKFIHSHCYRADEILMLLRVASELGIRVWSLQHVLEGYKVAPEIVAHGASCSTFSDWWAYKVEAYDATPYNAALLTEAGANVVIKSDDSELIRHLYHEAAKTVRYGNMPMDEAIRTITLNPARELGLEERLGSLEVGKDGDLAIFNGHPLSAFSRCEMTLIEGEVYFAREHAPTAMSEDAQARSAKPPELTVASLEARNRLLDLAEVQNGRYALTNATLYPVDGSVIPSGTLLIEEARITAIGTDLPIPAGSKVIDCAGMHIAPGFIDAGTQLGLVEIGKVAETHDYSEGGLFQPDLRAGVGLNVDSELIPVARSGGITSIMIRPTGGVIAGQTSIAQLSGWTAPEMVRNYEAGLQVIWPAAKKQQDELRDFLEEARLYDRLQTAAEKAKRPGPTITDPRLEALRPYVTRQKPVFMEAHSRQAIAEALLFAEKEKLDIIITGGTDAWKLAEELKKRSTPVIVGPVMRSPMSSTDPSDAPYANPGRLFEAGVKFCIRSDDAANSRNAPLEAAMAVAYGLPKEEGLRAVTLSAAEILGIEKQVGSLTPSKTANLVILDGHPLQHTSNIKGVFIAGKPFTPDSRQIRFYNRYRQRLLDKKSPTEQTNATEENKTPAE